MKKSVLGVAIVAAMGLAITGQAQAAAVAMNSATFDMYRPDGSLMGSDPAVTGAIDTAAGTWSVSSTNTFESFLWNAHDGTLFTSTFTIDTMKGETPFPSYTGVQLSAGQLGGHILFDWGAATTTTDCLVANCNIDVVNVWDVATGAGVTTYISSDADGNKLTGGGVVTDLGPNGTPGLPMIDGGFIDFSANFSFETDAAVIPVPAAVWLFGSGLMGLVGVARRRRKQSA